MTLKMPLIQDYFESIKQFFLFYCVYILNNILFM